MTEERDPKVSARYRELGAEEPPRALDEAILRASRAANEAPHAPLVTPAGRHRWYFPLAAAAILVLAVAVTVQVERNQPDDSASVLYPSKGEPAPEKREVQEKPQPQAAEERPLQEKAAREAEKAARRATPEAREAPQPVAPRAREPAVLGRAAPGGEPSGPAAPTPFPGDAAGAASQASRDLAARRDEALAKRAEVPPPAPSESGRAQADSARVAAAPPPAPAAKPAPAPRMMAKPMASAEMRIQTPEGELERIAELRRQGRHDEADKALEAFRKLYPDYRMSDEMRLKVEKK